MNAHREAYLEETERRLEMWDDRLQRILRASSKPPPEVLSLFHKRNSFSNKLERLRQTDDAHWKEAVSAAHHARRELEDVWSSVVSRSAEHSGIGSRASGTFAALAALVLRSALFC